MGPRMEVTMATASPILIDRDDSQGCNSFPDGQQYRSITDRICGIVEKPKPPRAWYVAFAISSSLTVMLFALIGLVIAQGVGEWGNNAPVFWAWPIVNFVF